MSNKWTVQNLVEEASGTEESENESEGEVQEKNPKENSDNEDELSGLDIPAAKLPVLHSIVNKGKTLNHDQQQSFQDRQRSDEAEKLAIREELSALTFEELQKLKEKIGSKKFNQTLIGVKKKPQVKADFKRANPNRPREVSSKSRRIEPKVAIQVPKVFRSDPRFDNLCGEFHEKKFYKNYDFVNKMKEEEVKKLKEELQEETNPRRIEKMKYLIQRMENQIRSEKMRKLEEEKQREEKQITIDALNEGKSPYFATKAARKERDLKEKFDSLKEDGRLNQYMAKKRKHNAQRDRRHMPSEDY